MEPYTSYNLDVTDKRFFNWCVESGLIEVSPIARFKLFEPERPKHPAPSLAQVNSILGLADETRLPVIAVAAFTGLRIGEIRDLKPDDVDLDAGVIRVRVGKTKAATREVPIHPRLAEILGGYGGFDGKYLFNASPSNRYPDGTHHINPRTINVAFKDLAKHAGLDVGRKDQGLTLHALRRFFKTSCLDAGVPKPLVDLWLGHSSELGIDAHYYRPQNSAEWMAKVAFGKNPKS